MYERFYQLRERPFALTPDPGYLYCSRIHTTALTRLREGLANGSGLTVLTGEIGSGKTTLLHTVVRDLPLTTSVCWIVNTQLDAQELVEAIVLGFGLEPRPNASEAQLIDHLARFLSDEQWVGRQTLLIIDEAQNLGLIALDALLAALEDAGAPQPRVVLVGQPSLADLLRTKELEGLRRRTGISHHLVGLDATDTVAYINHRLGHASLGVAPRFSEAAARLIHHHSQGMPRRINILCDTVLLHGYGEGRPAIDVEIARTVLADLERSGASEPAAGTGADADTGADAGTVNWSRPDQVPVWTETFSPEQPQAAAELQEKPPSGSWRSRAGTTSWLETPSRLVQASVRPAVARLLARAGALERDERARLVAAGATAVVITSLVGTIYVFMKTQVHEAAAVLWLSAQAQAQPRGAPASPRVLSPTSGEPDRPAARTGPLVAPTPASKPGAAAALPSTPKPVSPVSGDRATVKPAALPPGPPARPAAPATSRGTTESVVATAGDSPAPLQPVPQPSVEALPVVPEPPSGLAMPVALRLPTAEIPAATIRPAPPTNPPPASATSAPVSATSAPVSATPAPVSATPAPASATPAPAPAPAAAVAPGSVDERSVRAVVNKYQSAFSTLNAAAAKAVWPSVDERTLSRAFSQLESQDFRFDGCQVSVRGSRALAICSGNARFVPRVGDRTPRQEPRLWTFDLQKSNSEWMIQKVEAR